MTAAERSFMHLMNKNLPLSVNKKSRILVQMPINYSYLIKFRYIGYYFSSKLDASCDYAHLVIRSG